MKYLGQDPGLEEEHQVKTIESKKLWTLIDNNISILVNEF